MAKRNETFTSDQVEWAAAYGAALALHDTASKLFAEGKNQDDPNTTQVYTVFAKGVENEALLYEQAARKIRERGLTHE